MKTARDVNVFDQKHEDEWSAYNGDGILVARGLPDESVGFVGFSPPFGTDLYAYSDDAEDMGNGTAETFWAQFGFLIMELYRCLMPGRVVAVHCMDMPTFKRNGDEIGLADFPADIVKAFVAKGFIFHSRHLIWKDPLIAATRTHAVGLAHQQIVKDSTMCHMGVADQVLAFRKPGDNPKPVANEGGLTVYHGTRPVPRELSRYVGWKDQRTNKRSHWIWQQYASPFWDDIDQTDVLPFVPAKDPDDRKHICPLQLQVIERMVALWSAPGDVVFSPFMGVGSEVYVAVRAGRKGVGAELKGRYYRQALRNLARVGNVRRSMSARKGPEEGSDE